MACEWAEKVQGWYDGELLAGDRARVEAHVRECGDCAALALELHELSRLIATSSMAELTPAAQRKMRQAWWAARDRGVLHLAEWLTGAAAAVLIGALMLTSHPEPVTAGTASAATWQTAAVMPPTTVNGEGAPQVVVLSQWMASDLSSSDSGQ